ncbi:uncharacterized protein [Montipora capricornis]|uniref:uncharacterized protein n=1 Tax=Montipora capricornis TaxID=246305 RepID=UPI0035F1D566
MCPCFNPNTVSINELQWINIDGSVVDSAQGMANNAHISDDDIAQVSQGDVLADMSRLVFRDPDHFRAGELYRHASRWNTLLDDLNDKRFSEVRDWINNGVDVTKLFRPFKGLAKSQLTPQKQVPYLGFVIDSELQAFTLMPLKKEKFLRLVKETLPRDTLDLLTLQRLSGKCMSLSLAVPGARLYVNEINLAVSRATRSSRPVKMSPALRNEIEHWLFLESWDGFLRWQSKKHTHVRLFSDASHFAWGGALSPNAIKANVRDHWDASTIQADIATKETLALNNVLESFAETIKNSWVDTFVDNMVLIRSWNRQGSRSQSISGALKKLFHTTTKLNIDLHLTFVPSSQNQADSPSRCLSLQDAKLCPSLWMVVQELYGGQNGHSLDLMARPSNAQYDLSGAKLPFFSENLLPGSLGVNMFAQSPDLYHLSVFKNPYVFPPICLILHDIKYMRSLRLSYTIVVPDVCPRRFWWPLLASSCSSRYLLAVAGTVGALLTPSKNGFSNNWPIPWDFWVFRL